MGLWITAQYPGDAVRQLDLQRGGEIGDVRIQCYSENGIHVRVGAFLPGLFIHNPGDTPKVEPEKCEYARTKVEADAIFDRYVGEAYEDGWQNRVDDD